MESLTELQALQNATNGLNLTVHVKGFEDKRKSPKYFAQIGNETVSPCLNYDKMNAFLLGFRRAMELQARPKLYF